MADFEMTLHNPLTDDEWDLITDASLDNTKEITFITKQGKEVKFVKASADVRENVRGEWIKGGEQPYFRKHFNIVVCSVCNKRGERRWKFCPNCGCSMKGEYDERN